MENVRQKIQESMKSVKANLVSRDSVVEALFACALVGENAILLGPPGTGKSMLARRMSDILEGSKYFEILLNKYTTPDEVYGPVSISALKQDRYQRVTDGKMPDCHIAFIDEVFRGSSAILNTMLGIMNERVYHEGSRIVETPIQFVVGSSNDEPETDLDALYDRFLLRVPVGPVTGASAFNELLGLQSTPISRVSLEEWAAAKVEVAALPFDKSLFSTMYEIRSALQAFGINVSDRRMLKVVKYLKAVSWLSGDDEVSEESFAGISYVLSDRVANALAVQEVIAKSVKSEITPAERALKAIQDLYASLPDSSSAHYVVESNRATDKASEAIDQVTKHRDSMKRERNKRRCQEIRKEIASIAKSHADGVQKKIKSDVDKIDEASQ